MSFIPKSDNRDASINMAPMIDFLFLMLMFFACLAISRVTTKDSDIDLVSAKENTQTVAMEATTEMKVINISIDENGEYKWVTDIRDYAMQSPGEIAKELKLQYEKGILPSERENTHILLKIDRNARWEPILKAIFAIRDVGFEVHPVYLPEEVS